jgi:beta-glucosidase/6-phospho-beta-glucosidase/beta-galactosidase
VTISRPAIPFIGAFECTYQPVHDRDVLETTDHIARRESDLRLMMASHVGSVRYPVRWHRVELEPGVYDWADTDVALGMIRDAGMEPIVDLLHHTSYPAWIGDFSDPGFGDAFVRFVEAVAVRYPWLPAYTVCNEPFTTLHMCGDAGVWPPHRRGLAGFVEIANNVFPAVTKASRLLRDLLPSASHFHVEVCERHSSEGRPGAALAEVANDRRFLLIDLMVGGSIDPTRPFVERLTGVPGGDELLSTEPGHVDVLGLDYYAHNQWHWSMAGEGTNVSPAPPPLSDLIGEYWDRYRLPCALGETNIRGFAADRASWLKYTLEQCENARAAGVDLRGYCWYPFIDSADWGSLLLENTGDIDPVGVFWLDDRLDRRPSSMSVAFAVAAAGAPSTTLPAYRFRSPVAEWLAGWMPHMAHWDWQDPPLDEVCSSTHAPDDQLELVAFRAS